MIGETTNQEQARPTDELGRLILTSKEREKLARSLWETAKTVGLPGSVERLAAMKTAMGSG